MRVQKCAKELHEVLIVSLDKQMDSTETKALASDSQMTSAMDKELVCCCKDTILNLPRQQKRILLHLVKSAEPQSVADIILALGQTDPRGHISRLRKRGYPIADTRCKYGNSFYKRYYLRKEVLDE